jgi:hypothetical protein
MAFLKEVILLLIFTASLGAAANIVGLNFFAQSGSASFSGVILISGLIFAVIFLGRAPLAILSNADRVTKERKIIYNELELLVGKFGHRIENAREKVDVVAKISFVSSGSLFFTPCLFFWRD